MICARVCILHFLVIQILLGSLCVFVLPAQINFISHALNLRKGMHIISMYANSPFNCFIKSAQHIVTDIKAALFGPEVIMSCKQSDDRWFNQCRTEISLIAGDLIDFHVGF